MKTTGRVNGIISNIVIVKADGPVGQNEICHVYCGDTKMMAEVIKVVGDNAYVQVFDSTRGLKIGEKVEFEGHMLEATLAPGLLSRNYDGLQNDLEKMDGLFIARGSITDPIDFEKKWEFKPLAKPGDKVSAASWLGQVKEEWVEHKIMVPFTMEGTYTVKSVVPAGEYKVTDTIAVITDADGRDHDITMVQRWPVKQAVRCYREKPRPSRVMETGVRAIDTFNPLAEGGTGFIPGPFGAGKTVLQHAISKQADADVIIIVACGERANEVVEIFKEFPELVDPRTGHKLMERTIIICNTSNMPVAAREASVYTGMTIGEYYRSMGLKVLVMADSTSRWAQALREMSNRLEELPGQDAFPVDLSAIISNFYARAGLVKLNNGKTGSVTFLGTVSPAGGNLKEPVTESTKEGSPLFLRPFAGPRRLEALPGYRPAGVLLEIPRISRNRGVPRRPYRKGLGGEGLCGQDARAARQGGQRPDQHPGRRRRAGGVPRTILEIGADRLRDPAAGCFRRDRRQLPDRTPEDDVRDGARHLRPGVRVRRIRGVRFVLQGPDQPLPSDELFGVEIGEIRGLPPSDRENSE